MPPSSSWCRLEAAAERDAASDRADGVACDESEVGTTDAECAAVSVGRAGGMEEAVAECAEAD